MKNWKIFIEKNLNNFKTTKKLALQVNKEFKLSINYHKVYYQESKIMKEKFGDPSKDALNLISYSEKLESEGECMFFYKTNEVDELSHFIYGSRQMIDIPLLGRDFRQFGQ